MYRFGAASLKEMTGVHPGLVRVWNHAISISLVDFAVHDGLRTLAEQTEYVRAGVSTTMNSMHLPQPDGFGHASDLVPYVNGKLRWEWPPIYQIAEAVRASAVFQDVRIVWGGVWDRTLNDLPSGANNLEKEVQAYVSRRRRLGKRKVFIDGPHFQLGKV